MSPSEATTAQHRRDARWQQKLLPLMQRMLVALTAFFILATVYQAYGVQQRIAKLGQERFQLAAAADGKDVDVFRARVGLEAFAIQQRYQHSSLILMSRAWIIYLGFVTGMILAMVGATFILGKLQESESELTAKSQAGEFSVKSASPGLIMTVLGTALMISTMVIRADVTVTDTPLYFMPEVRVSGGGAPAPPANLPFEGRPAGKTIDDSALDVLHDSGKDRSGPKR